MAARVGVIVNPVAGMGGRVGLHGTDGEELLAEALRRGAAPVTPARARRALRRLAELALAAELTGRSGVAQLVVLCPPGEMGAGVVAASGLSAEVLELALPARTAGADTAAAARLLAAAGVDRVLFAGGDGTAADVVAGCGPELPVIGIPSGVKMRSGVFATGPEAAGELAARFLADPRRPTAVAAVLDAPVAGAGPGAGPGGGSELAGVLRGLATVPALGRGTLIGPKSGSAFGSPLELAALARAVAAELEPGALYLFGPGSTTGLVLAELGLASTPLGVDAVRDGKLLGSDLAESELLGLMAGSSRTRLVLGVIGGQGVLLGRGNQQLGPAVLARLRADDVVVLAAAEKLLALDPPRLLVDAGDEEPLAWFTSYQRVRVGPARFVMMRVESAAPVAA